MPDAALRELLWASEALWAALVDRDGTIVEANGALRRRPDALPGAALDDLVAAPQRPRVRRALADAGARWETVLVGFHSGGAAVAEDRLLHVRREGERVLAVAEPAVDAQERLVAEVLALNEDLIGTHRVLARERRDEAAVASALQQSLLPDRLAEAPGLRLAARYAARTRGTQVGGDFYDAFDVAGGRVALAIGDVRGKGLRAAAMMGRLRSALRAYALVDPFPASVFERLDRFMAAEDDTATAALLVLDPATGQAALSVAGHPPPLLVHGGRATPLGDAVAPPLGSGLGTHRGVPLDLPAGARVILYTDGLVERDAGIIAGLARLAELAAAPGLELEQLVDAVLAGSDEASFRDDVAILAAERC